MWEEHSIQWEHRYPERSQILDCKLEEVEKTVGLEPGKKREMV